MDFSEVLQCKPPRRVTRAESWSWAEELSRTEERSHSHDFTSSAECTPEIDQPFLARCVAPIPVFLPTDAHTHQYPAREERRSSPTSLRIADPSKPSRVPSYESPSRSASLRSSSWRAPSSQSSGRASLASNRAEDALATHTMPSSSCRWLRPDKPFLSWSQWLRELVMRGTIMEDEGIVMCGSIVQRTVPCFKPKVLMLTNAPRLLLLNPSGCRLLTEIPLTGPNASRVVGKSISDFELIMPRNRRCFSKNRVYCCCEVEGAEEWRGKIEASRELAQRQSQRQVRGNLISAESC